MADELESGSWAEWRRAVLGDLKRLSHEQREQGQELRTIATNVEIIRAGQSDEADLEKRVAALEAKGDAGTQRNEDRKWLIGLAVLVVASILFPSLRVVLFGGGGG